MQKLTLAEMQTPQQVVIVIHSGQAYPQDVPLGHELEIKLEGGAIEHYLCCAGCEMPVRRELAQIYGGGCHGGTGDPYCPACAQEIEEEEWGLR